MKGARGTRVAQLAVVLTVTLTSGCFESSADLDKAGGSPGPVVLRLAGAADLREAPAVAYFVRRLEALSGGAVRVDVLDQWGAPDPGSEGGVLNAVTAGDVDLGWVGSSLLAYVGLPGFDALGAPMLIDSSPLEQAVLLSSIPGRSLRGLGRIRLVGLGILAEGLARPVAGDAALVGPADWRGIRFGTEATGTRVQALRALGAVLVPVTRGSLVRELEEGRIQAFDLDLAAFVRLGLADRAAHVTANVALWPRWDVLLADPDALASLTEEERDWVRRAAQEAAAESVALTDRDQEFLDEACRSGAVVSMASAAEISTLRRSIAVIYRRLDQDRVTRGFLKKIRALKRSTPGRSEMSVPRTCRSHPSG
jgi:TRAP-type C4-dicarboxylate transport system substrate-binding protein